MLNNIINGQYTPNGFTTRPNPPKPQEPTPASLINLDAYTWEDNTLYRISKAVEAISEVEF